MALVSREGSAQMALVGKAAGERDLGEVETAFAQQSLSPVLFAVLSTIDAAASRLPV
jgi:hypothetical protein